MRKLWMMIFFTLAAATSGFADSQDTVVFRTRMLPDNENPAISAPGNSANATITVHVTRDDKANVNAATVTFDIDYTISSALTFTGLHIHNGTAAQNGPVVINTGISSGNPVTAAAGSGKITRVVNYASTDTDGIRFVTGLLATPANYYVNIHTTVNPNGFMRGQFQSSHLIFRPVMSPVFENPPINIDAEGAALIDVQVNRDATGAITSGTVVFDVSYRFPAPVTITGLHIHNGPIGVNAPVVIDTGTNANATAVTNVTRGSIYRIVEINSSNTVGLAALNGLFTDPSQYYVNMHTTVNPGGVIRGQLSPDNVYVFFHQMTQDQENPPTGVTGYADSMTYVRIDRDSTGNVVSGAVSFNVHPHIGSATTFTGLHIHNAKAGVNGPVVINSGIGGQNTFTHPTGEGSINQVIEIRPTDAAFDFLRGLVENPENYYINIHTTQFPNGVVRAQMAPESFHFKANMSPANEVPPITGVDTAATGWITANMSRNATGALVGGNVTFDVNYSNTGPMTVTGLHIHYPGQIGVNASVVINTGVSGGAPVDSPSGSGNITRVVAIDPNNSTAIATLNALMLAPDTAYVNIHTTQYSGGVARSQMFPVSNTVAQVSGGGDWTSMITIRNNSSTAAVQGIVDFFNSDGTLMPDAITRPSIQFLIPASGTTTLTTHNKGNMAAGFAKVFSNGSVSVESRYIHPSFTANNVTSTTVTGTSLSIPVAVGATANQNTGVSLIANSAGTLNLSLRDSTGTVIAGGSRSITVTQGQQISSFVTQLLPSVTATRYTGTLTISASAGSISALALQFDGAITPVTVTAQ